MTASVFGGVYGMALYGKPNITRVQVRSIKIRLYIYCATRSKNSYYDDSIFRIRMSHIRHNKYSRVNSFREYVRVMD